MHVLCCLALSPGRVVSRSALLDAVWSKAVVNEEALTQAISQLRRVFGDDARRPEFIQTIHKTGYRLVHPVTWVPQEEAGQAPGGVSLPPGADRVPAVEPAAARHPLPGATPVPAQAGPHAARRHSRARVVLLLAGLALVVLVVSVMATLPRSRQAVQHRPVVLDQAPFTSYPGSEIHPAISPDGSRIAFVWNGGEEGNYDVFVKQRNTETPLRLTATEADECFPAWSPDGTEIAYCLIGDGEISINVIPAIGGSPRRVATAGGVISGLDWSSDGDLLAYGARDGADAPVRVFVCTLSTGEARPVTEPEALSRGDFRPVFSPDGRRLAFIRGDRTGLQDIFVVPVAGGRPERLTNSLHNIAGLDWTPDGKSLVFSAAPTRITDSRLWRLSVGDGSLTWLPVGVKRPARLAVAQSGRGLVIEESAVSAGIVRVRVASPEEGPQPVAASTRHDYDPQYSPGGRFIAFISTRSGSPQVWVCGADGEAPRQVTEFENACIWNPCWSYDERRVAFSAAPENVAGIYVADVETGRVRCVSESERHQVALGWSRDDRSLYCKVDRDGHWWVRKIALDGGGRTDIVERNVFRLAESIDGRNLIFSRSDTSGVWSVSADGTDEVCLASEPDQVVACGWREVERGLYFFSLAAGQDRPRTITLCFRDRATGETSVVATSVDFVGFNIDISPEGDYVLADRLQELGSDLALVRDFR